MLASHVSFQEKAFSLIELRVVMSLVGILASVALPSYFKYVSRSNRVQAVSYLMNLANKEEQIMLDTHQYSTSYSTLLPVPSEVSTNYTISVAVNNSAAPPTYTITATPINVQLAGDAKCGTLTLNQAGTTTKSGTDTVQNCWGGR